LVVFELDATRRLVDLPGFGYARVPESLRAHWHAEIDAYLRQRESLRGVVLIADIRHPLKAFDRQMLAFCAACNLACLLLLTKADKLSRGQVQAALAAARRLCSDEDWPAAVQAFSATAGTGVDQAREAIWRLLA
jgi:GTP-binding protein